MSFGKSLSAFSSKKIFYTGYPYWALVWQKVYSPVNNQGGTGPEKFFFSYQHVQRAVWTSLGNKLIGLRVQMLLERGMGIHTSIVWASIPVFLRIPMAMFHYPGMGPDLLSTPLWIYP